MAVGDEDSRPAGGGERRTARPQVTEELGSGVLVPMNHANQNWKPLAEDGEAGPLIKENTHQYSTRPDTERNSRVPEIGGRAESRASPGAKHPR